MRQEALGESEDTWMRGIQNRGRPKSMRRKTEAREPRTSVVVVHSSDTNNDAANENKINCVVKFVW
jgi:hypothetical protein